MRDFFVSARLARQERRGNHVQTAEDAAAATTKITKKNKCTASVGLQAHLLLRQCILHDNEEVISIWSDHDLVLLSSQPQELKVVLGVQVARGGS